MQVLGAAHRHLFGSPRAWVRALAECTMRQHGLRPGAFQSVHIRLSAEKAVEVAKARREMPSVSHFALIARALASASGLADAFVQTASPAALANLSLALSGGALRLSHTRNQRYEGDAWGGWVSDPQVITTQTAVAAVNAYISQQAAALVSPSISIWTTFLGYLMARGPNSTRTASFTCRSPHGPRVRVGYVRVVLAKDHPTQLSALRTAVATLAGPGRLCKPV